MYLWPWCWIEWHRGYDLLIVMKEALLGPALMYIVKVVTVDKHATKHSPNALLGGRLVCSTSLTMLLHCTTLSGSAASTRWGRVLEWDSTCLGWIWLNIAVWCSMFLTLLGQVDKGDSTQKGWVKLDLMVWQSTDSTCSGWVSHCEVASQWMWSIHVYTQAHQTTSIYDLASS